jgi:hypothetical protein
MEFKEPVTLATGVHYGDQQHLVEYGDQQHFNFKFFSDIKIDNRTLAIPVSLFLLSAGYLYYLVYGSHQMEDDVDENAGKKIVTTLLSFIFIVFIIKQQMNKKIHRGYQEKFLFLKEDAIFLKDQAIDNKVRLTPDTYCFGSMLDSNREGMVVCVDKTTLIPKLIGTKKSRFVFLRPRRWGKSYNDHIIKEFFDVNGAKNLFEESLISHDIKFCEEYQNAFFIVFFDFKDLHPNSYRKCLANLSAMIKGIYEKIEKYYGSQMNRSQRRKCKEYKNIFCDTASNLSIEGNLEESLRYIGTLVSECTSNTQKIVLIIDEYDTPIFSAYCNEDNHEEKSNDGEARDPLYKKIAGLLRATFSPFSKGGELFNVKYVVITGILHIAREVFLSGANAIEFSPLRSEMSDHFGFTEKEVKTLLEFFKLDQDGRIEEEIREWYGNYYMGFGEQHKILYNPYAIINFLSDYKINNQVNFQAYWTATSASDIHLKFLEKLKDYPGEYKKFISYFKILFDNKPVQVAIKTHISFNDLQECERSADQLMNFFYLTGFLTHIPYNGHYNAEFSRKKLTECSSALVIIPNRDVLSACQSILKDHMLDHDFSPVFRRRSSIVRDYAEFSNIVVSKNQKEKEALSLISFLFFSYDSIYPLQFKPLRKSQRAAPSDGVEGECKEDGTFLLEERLLYRLILSDRDPIGTLSPSTIFLYKKEEEFYAKITNERGITETLCLNRISSFDQHNIHRLFSGEGRNNIDIPGEEALDFIQWLVTKTDLKIKTSGWFLQARDSLGELVQCDLEKTKKFPRLFHYLINNAGYDRSIIHDLVFSGLGYFSISPYLVDLFLSAPSFPELGLESKEYIRRCARDYPDDLVRLHREHRLSYDADTIELATQSVLAIFPFNADGSDTYNTSRSHFCYVDAYVHYVKTFDFSLSDSLYTLFFRVITYEIYMNFNMRKAQRHIDYLLARMKSGKTRCTHFDSKKIALEHLNIIALFYDYSAVVEEELNVLAKRILNEEELRILGLSRQGDLDAQREYEHLEKSLPEKEHILYRTRILYRFGRMYYRKEYYRKAQACFDHVACYQKEIEAWLATFSIFISHHKPENEITRRKERGQPQAGEIKRVGYVYREKDNIVYTLLDGRGHLEEEHFDQVLIKQEADSELRGMLTSLLGSIQENEIRELNALERWSLINLFLENHLQLTTNKHRYQFYKKITDLSINENKSYPLRGVSAEEVDQVVAQGIYLFKKENTLWARVVYSQGNYKEIDLKQLPGASQYVKEKKINSLLEGQAELDFFVKEEEMPILSAFVKSACQDLYASENRAKVSQLNEFVDKIKQRKSLNILYSHICLEVLQFQLQYAPETIQFEDINRTRTAILANYSTRHAEYAEWLHIMAWYVLMGGGVPSLHFAGMGQLETKEEQRRSFDVEGHIRNMIGEMSAIYRLSLRETHPKLLLFKQLEAYFLHKKGHDNNALHLYTEVLDGYKREGMHNRIGRIYNNIADIHKYMGNHGLASFNYNEFKETITSRKEMTRHLEGAQPDLVSAGILSLNLAEMRMLENDVSRANLLRQLHEAHRLFSAANIIRYIIAVNCQIASEYKMRMEYDHALKVLENIHHLVETTPVLPAKLILTYYQLQGSIHKLQNNFDQAWVFYKKAKEICDENSHALSAILIQDVTILRAGLIFIQTGDIRTYMKEIDKGRSLIEGTNNIYYMEKYGLKKCHLLIVNRSLDEAKKRLDLLKGALPKVSSMLSNFARVKLNYLMGRIHYHNKDYEAAKQFYRTAKSHKSVPYYQEKLEFELAKITYIEKSSDVFFLKPSMSRYVQDSLFKILSLVESAKDLKDAIINELPSLEKAYKSMLEKWSSELHQDFKPNWEHLKKSHPKTQLRYLFSMAINFIILQDPKRYKEINDMISGLMPAAEEEQDDIVVSILISGFWLNINPKDLYEKYIQGMEASGKKYFKYPSVNYGLACLSNVIGWKYENTEKADLFFKRSTDYFKEAFNDKSDVCARAEYAQSLFLREKRKHPEERYHDELGKILNEIIEQDDPLPPLFFHTRMEMRCVVGGIKRLLEEYTCVLMDAKGLAFYLKIKWLKHCDVENNDIQDIMEQFSEYAHSRPILSNQYLLADARIILGQLSPLQIDHAIQSKYGQDYAIQKLHEHHQRVMAGEGHSDIFCTDSYIERMWEYFTRQFFELQFFHHRFILANGEGAAEWSVTVGDAVLCIHLKVADEKHQKHLCDLLVDLKLRFSLLFDYLESADNEVKIINYKLYIKSDTRYIETLRTIFLSVNLYHSQIQWLFQSRDKIEDHLYGQGIKRLHAPMPGQKKEWKNTLNLYRLIITQLKSIREGQWDLSSLLRRMRESLVLQPASIRKLLTDLPEQGIDLKIIITEEKEKIDAEYRLVGSDPEKIELSTASTDIFSAEEKVEVKQGEQEEQSPTSYYPSSLFLPEMEAPEGSPWRNDMKEGEEAFASPSSLAKRRAGGASQAIYSLHHPPSPSSRGLFSKASSEASNNSLRPLPKKLPHVKSEAEKALDDKQHVPTDAASRQAIRHRRKSAASTNW